MLLRYLKSYICNSVAELRFTKKCISYINIVHVELFPLHKSSNMSFMLMLFSKNARNSYNLSPYPDKSSEIGILDDVPSRKVVLVV